MTLEEIKSTYTMQEIIDKYGMKPNRAGFCHCPFHRGDRTASLKIYKDSFYCFGCGKHGDVVDFVQLMDGLSFKEAFVSLGGTYEDQDSFSARIAAYRAKKKRERRKAEQERKAQKRKELLEAIETYRNLLDSAEPLSSVWCDAYNNLQKKLNELFALNGMEF